MKSSFPFPVCEENFLQCWNYMDEKRRQIRVRVLTAKLGGFFSNLVFFFSLLFGANGLILLHFSGSYCSFLRGLPFFMKSWMQISKLFPAGNSLSSDLLRLLFLSYLTGVALFLVLRLLVTLLYHPKKRTVPEGSYPQVVPQLASLTREVWQQSFKTHISTSVVSILLLIIAAFILFFAYTFYLEDASAAQELLSRFPTSDMGTNAVLYVFFAYIIGHFLCLPILLITRPLYYSGFPYAVVADTAAAALFAGESVEGLSEEAIAKQRLENAAALRKEGLQAEYQSGYRIAKALYLKAALGGDIPAMEHYARHCLLAHEKEAARYWLDKAAASGEISPEGKNMRQRLKTGRNLNVGYLREGVDSSLKAVRHRSTVHLLKNILSLVMLLVLSAALLVASVRYFGGDEASLVAELKELLKGMSENISEEMAVSPTEETIVANIPLQALMEAGTRWEGLCIAYDEAGAPMVSCYTQDAGGDLAVNYTFPEGEKLSSAQVYFGNIYDVRNITKHVSYDDGAQTVVIAEKYLQGLKPGEYFIILNKGSHYFPLLVQETAAEYP